MSTSLSIWPIPALHDNYIWVMMHPAKSICVIIDPGEAQPVLNELNQRNLKLAGILITHHHWDHTHGIDGIIAQYPAPVFAPHSTSIPHTTHPLKEGDEVTLPEMGLSCQVIETPAHTQDHISYYGHGALFCGDTLFTGGCGRLFEGTAQQMFRSLGKLMDLPDTTRVYCGHEYTQKNLQFAKAVEPHNLDLQNRIKQVDLSRQHHQPTVPETLGVEKKTNPFLRCHTPQVKEAAEKRIGNTLNDPVDVLSVIRAWKDQW